MSDHDRRQTPAGTLMLETGTFVLTVTVPLWTDITQPHGISSAGNYTCHEPGTHTLYNETVVHALTVTKPHQLVLLCISTSFVCRQLDSLLCAYLKLANTQHQVDGSGRGLWGWSAL